MSDKMIDVWEVQQHVSSLVEPIAVAWENLDHLKPDDLNKQLNHIDDVTKLLLVMLDPNVKYPQNMKSQIELLICQLDNYWNIFSTKYYKETN